MQDNEYMTVFLEESRRLLRAHLDESKKVVGPSLGREQVSPKEQMAAYDALTAEDIQTMVQQKGLDKTNEYIGAMEMRKRRSKNGIQT